MYERGIEHQNDIPACKTSSHMLRHLLAEYEEEEEDWEKIEFGMRIVKSTRSVFEHQILESVTIQKKKKPSHNEQKGRIQSLCLAKTDCKAGGERA